LAGVHIRVNTIVSNFSDNFKGLGEKIFQNPKIFLKKRKTGAFSPVFTRIVVFLAPKNRVKGLSPLRIVKAEPLRPSVKSRRLRGI